jgi:hypothetical protein
MGAKRADKAKKVLILDFEFFLVSSVKHEAEKTY